MESLLTELEASAQEQRRRNVELASQQSAQAALLREYNDRVQGLAKEIRARKQEALSEAKSVIDKSNALIERLVKEIRESGAQKEVVNAVRREVDNFRREIETSQAEMTVEDPDSFRGSTLSVGSTVLLDGSADPGEIVDLSEDGKTAVVLFGSVRMKVPVSNLRPGSKKRKQTASATRHAYLDRSEQIARDLDLRGMTGDEALPLIDKFIDDAFLSGLKRIDIIHGKGTGALRKKVIEFLAEHKRVASFRPGEWNEGGLGVTIVEIKES